MFNISSSNIFFIILLLPARIHQKCKADLATVNIHGLKKALCQDANMHIVNPILYSVPTPIKDWAGIFGDGRVYQH